MTIPSCGCLHYFGGQYHSGLLCHLILKERDDTSDGLLSSGRPSLQQTERNMSYGECIDPLLFWERGLYSSILLILLSLFSVFSNIIFFIAISFAGCWWLLLVAAAGSWWLLVAAAGWWLLGAAGGCWWLAAVGGGCW